MKVWRIVVPVIGGVGLLTSVLLGLKPPVNSSGATSSAVPDVGKMFGGVSLSELDGLAKEIHHGLSCGIDKWGFLIFNWKSNGGHQTFHSQMMIDEAGRLVNLSGNYPGQIWSTADEFAKRANEVFSFKTK